MKLSFDPEFNVAYLQIKPLGPGEARTVEVTEDVNIDYGPDGSVCGIELLNANVQLSTSDAGQFILENTSVGKTAELALPK